jgi:two-component system chemotaxis response regulator CheB
MPELDGIETLKAIRRIYPSLPVIMFGGTSDRSPVQTIDALSNGASEVVAKPSGLADVAAVQRYIREQLIPRIKSIGVAAIFDPSSRGELPPMVARPNGRPPEAIVIGVSTGGPNALAALLSQLPASLPVPVLIVQHMPPMFTRLLAERLDAHSALSVVEARDGEPLANGTVYIAPGDYHLGVAVSGGIVRTALHQGPPENSCRPAADVLFHSASSVFRERLLAIVLTGMGRDGLRGCEEVRRHGGRILVQDRRSSVVWGMPGFVVGRGLAEAVLPLDDIAEYIVRCWPSSDDERTRAAS